MKPKDEIIERCYLEFVYVDWPLLHKNIDRYNVETMVDRCTLPLVQRLRLHYIASKKDCDNSKNQSVVSSVTQRARNIAKTIGSAEEQTIGQTRKHGVDIRPQITIKYSMGKDVIWPMIRAYIQQRVEPLYSAIERELKQKNFCASNKYP